MELNSIINDDSISMKIQDIYKYIDKHESDFDTIFNRTYNDIKNLYQNVSFSDDTIEVFDENTTNNIDLRNKCIEMLSYHSKEILKDKSYLMTYAFKFSYIGNKTIITRKR